MIEIDIASTIYALDEYYDDMKFKAVVQAARTSIDRTLISARALAIKRIKQQYKLKPSGLSAKTVKDKLIKHYKAKGNDIHKLKGTLLFKGKPIPLLKFVSGNKQVIKQKGVKIRKRRKLKVEIKPGKKIKLDGAFIQKVHSKQVFRRKPKGKKLYKQSVPSIGELIGRQFTLKALAKHVEKKWGKEFNNQFQFRMGKLNARLAKKRLKLHGVR